MRSKTKQEANLPREKVAAVFLPVCFHDLLNGLFTGGDNGQPRQKCPQPVLLPARPADTQTRACVFFAKKSNNKHRIFSW